MNRSIRPSCFTVAACLVPLAFGSSASLAQAQGGCGGPRGGWTVTFLDPIDVAFTEAYAISMPAGGVGLSRQAGVSIRDINSSGHATFWNGSASSFVDLNPSVARYSEARAIDDTQQVGYAWFHTGEQHASLWRDTAESWVDLNPANAIRSRALAVHNGQQGGYATFPGETHAGLWSGTADSWVDLQPSSDIGFSQVLAMSEGQQVGSTRQDSIGYPDHAALWRGTPESWVDLHPAGHVISMAFAAHDGRQGGWTRPTEEGGLHACIWSGTADSLVDLSQASFVSSEVKAMHGRYQVGTALVSSDGRYHAALWSGSAGSFIDLSEFLPEGYYWSHATGITADDDTVYIIGHANNPQGRHQAVLWTFPLEPLCAADINADTFVNSQDFFDLLNDFFALNPAADFNHDGVINSQDFFDFLVRFYAGC